MSTAMAQSGAATSSTVGNQTPEQPIAEAALSALVVMGMESGRYHTLLPEKGEQKKIHEIRSKDRKFDISLQRLPEIIMVVTMMVCLTILASVSHDAVHHNNHDIPHDLGLQDGYVGVFFSSSATVGVVYFRHPLSGARTYLGWLNYIARYNESSPIVCKEQTPESPCHHDELVALLDQPWYTKTKRHAALPIAHMNRVEQRLGDCRNDSAKMHFKDMFDKFNKNQWEKSECFEMSFSEMSHHLLAVEVLGAKCAQTYNPSGFSRQNRCRHAARLARSIMFGRFKCYGGGMVDTLSTFVLYFTLICFLCCYFAPTFPRSWVFRWALYSKFFQLISRTLRVNSVVANPSEAGLPEVFLADGGHLDNSAVLPLLRRQCKVILAVDAESGRKCASLIKLVSTAQETLRCTFSIPPEETNVVGSLEDMMQDFRLPRVRYVGDGDDPAYDDCRLFERFGKVRQYVSGRGITTSEQDGDTKVRILQDGSTGMKRLVSHLRVRDGYVYMYFKDDASLCSAFKFGFMRRHFRVCQHVVDPKSKLLPEYYLPETVITTETARNVIHLKVHYTNGLIGDLYFLRGEMGPETLHRQREALKKWETLFATHGKFPFHKTGIGEGHSWEHIDAYAEYARVSAEQAWSMQGGLKEHFSSRSVCGIAVTDELRARGYADLAERFSLIWEALERDECPRAEEEIADLKAASAALKEAEEKLIAEGLIVEAAHCKRNLEEVINMTWRVTSRESQYNPEGWIA